MSDGQTTSLVFPEFKRNAAPLVLDQSYSHVDACRPVGVAESVLRRWVDQLQLERRCVTAQSTALTPEQQRIQELGAHIDRLEREKAILKNVWSAPDLQVAGFSLQQNNVCVNVSGLFAQCMTAGHDGIRAHQTQ